MQNIDFLPADYLQGRVERRWQPWHIVVVLAFAGLISTAALGQRHHRRQLEAELESIGPQRAGAEEQNSRLTDLQSRLKEASAEAELFTYLQYPWPRTQLIDALLAPLPEEITFDELTIDGETLIDNRNSPGMPSRKLPDAEKKTARTLLPASEDLQQLRAECDGSRSVVTVRGLATDSEALYRYLADLSRATLFAKTVLRSIEAESPGDGVQLRFFATVVVQPGYGQPGGPVNPNEKEPAVGKDKET
jgi:Tfp pilus assembly protein PilN